MAHDHEMMMMDGWAEDHSDLVTWPADTWLQGFQLRVVDGAGRELSRRLLHHYAVIDLDRRELVYPVAHRILGGGEESGDIRLAPTVGVPLPARPRPQASLMWNHDLDRDTEAAVM